MGFFDRIMSYAKQEKPQPDSRSPLEKDLIARMQDRIGDPLSGEAKTRFHMRFTGMVQGVGFRWTNQGLARDRHLAGWVQNIEDGSVEMELQGTPKQIITHLDMLHAYYRRFGNRIWLEQADEIAVHPDETEFEVKISPSGF